MKGVRAVAGGETTSRKSKEGERFTISKRKKEQGLGQKEGKEKEGKTNKGACKLGGRGGGSGLRARLNRTRAQWPLALRITGREGDFVRVARPL